MHSMRTARETTTFCGLRLPFEGKLMCSAKGVNADSLPARSERRKRGTCCIT
jgi:hypothetical protein